MYYYKGKYGDFEEFGGCYFFDKNKFMEEYDFIFKIKKNFKKVCIINIISISLSCISSTVNVLCNIKNN